MDDLPELPFEQVLSYLNLKDRLKARTVSRAWRNTFDSYPVNTLCYSNRPSDFIFDKNRWVSGAFAANFISSTRFASFFNTFGQTILSTLKRLRLCDLELSDGDRTAFARTLNSFSQLEQLDIIRVGSNLQDMFNLNLPMLTSLQLENVCGIDKLTLEAPRLREVRILECSAYLRVEIVHGESVKSLLVDRLDYTDVKNLKNLKVLYIGEDSIGEIDSTFLSGLQQLKEVHTSDPESVSKLFEQKQRSGRADLKIYLGGLLLNGPDDPAINVPGDFFNSDFLRGEWFVYLAENPSRLTDEIHFYSFLEYSNIERVAPGLVANLLKRFTELKEVIVDRPVENTQRFLDLLKNCENISELSFICDQPQDLFDQLPEHCAVQKLFIDRPPPDLAFLLRLKHLIRLDLYFSIDSETVRRAFDELPVLSKFKFRYGQMSASIQIRQSKQFHVSVGANKQKTASDLNAAIEFLFGKEKPSRLKKRKVEELE